MPTTPGTPKTQIIGHFRLGARLGKGGMGEVWQATDTRLGREVAIKLLPDTVADDAQRLGRFEREAKMLAALNHPGIAAIYGIEDKALVMELAPGVTLAEKIRAGGLAYEDALSIARQLAEALAYAHEKGVIHRDLKPSNIMISAEGQVKILDFGLAKAIQTESGQSASQSELLNAPTMSLTAATQPGMILGTAAYMAPEQARGQAVDRRADIWAFGVVIYEMLIGERLFGGATISDTLASVLKETPDFSRLPRPCQKLVRACLEKDPRQRLGYIGDAMLLLESAAALEPASVAHRRRRPGLVAAAWAGAIVLAAAAGWAIWRGMTPRGTAPEQFTTVTSFPGVQAQPAFSPDGRSVAFVANPKGHFNIFVSLIGGNKLIQITHGPNLNTHPAWSPDGTTLAYARLDRQGIFSIWLVEALGGTPQRLVSNASDPSWSPRGHRLAYANMSNGALWVIKRSGENAHAVAPDLTVAGDMQPRFSPNGQEIAFCSSQGGPYGNLAVLQLKTGKIRMLTHGALALSPVWSRGGKHIYFASSQSGTLNVWEIGRQGNGLRQITNGAGDNSEIDLSRQGRLLFTTLHEDLGIDQLSLDQPNAPPVMLTSDPARNQFFPTFSPDGKSLAYFSNLKGAEHEAIWVSRADGSHAVKLVQDQHLNIFPSWSPDGQFLAYEASGAKDSNRNLVRVIPATGGAPVTLTHGKWLFTPIYSSLGHVLMVQNHEIKSIFPDTHTIQVLGKAPSIYNYFELMAGPEGQEVAYVKPPTKENDPQSGLWVDDFHSPPRKVFGGWVTGIAKGLHQQIYFLVGSPDLTASLWKVQWNGSGLTRLPVTVPIPYDINYSHTEIENMFDVSPHGRRLAFQTERQLTEHIGMMQLRH